MNKPEQEFIDELGKLIEKYHKKILSGYIIANLEAVKFRILLNNTRRAEKR